MPAPSAVPDVAKEPAYSSHCQPPVHRSGWNNPLWSLFPAGGEATAVCSTGQDQDGITLLRTRVEGRHDKAELVPEVLAGVAEKQQAGLLT